VGQTEPAPDQTGTRKYRFNLFRYRIGRYIVIFGHFAHQQITNTSPNDIGFITFFLQTANDFGGVGAELLNRDTMFSGWNNNMLSNNKFPKLKKLMAQTLFEVERNDGGSLT
jgi:hypothetical protein